MSPAAQHLDRLREDAVIAQPRVTLPDAEAMFYRLAQRAGLQIRQSAVGAFAAGAVSLWGNLQRFAAALLEPASMSVLQGYTRPHPKEVEDVVGIPLAYSKRWFLDLEEIRTLAGIDIVASRELVDRWLVRGVVRRGLVLKCPLCRCATWYAVDDVGQQFRCARCRERSAITRDTWIQESPDAPWTYDLHEVVYQAVRLDCRAPILTLAALENGARARKFHYVHEQEVVLARDDSCEVDLWAIVEGKVVIGEAKTTDRLGKSKAEEAKVLTRLARVAELLTADIVIFASTVKWREATRTLVEKTFRGHRCEVRFFDEVGSEVLRL